MPAFLKDGLLKPATRSNDVAEYVLSLTGKPTDAAAAARGKPIFADQLRRLPWRRTARATTSSARRT